MSKIDFSLPREKYFKDELETYNICPKCQTPLDKEIVDIDAVPENKMNEIDEKELLKQAISKEDSKDYDATIDILEEILNVNPSSYHALFLKARISRKIGKSEIINLIDSLKEAIKQDASQEVFKLFEDEMKNWNFDKNTFIRNELLSLFIEKTNRNIEKVFGFNWYAELKDYLLPPIRQDHKKVVTAFFEFVDSDLKVIKTDDGTVEEIFDMPLDDIKKNMISLEKNEGRFYDEILEISYAFLGRNFFAYVYPGMIFFSAKKEDVEKMARIYDKYGLEYHEPYELKGRW